MVIAVDQSLLIIINTYLINNRSYSIPAPGSWAISATSGNEVMTSCF